MYLFTTIILFFYSYKTHDPHNPLKTPKTQKKMLFRSIDDIDFYIDDIESRLINNIPFNTINNIKPNKLYRNKLDGYDQRYHSRYDSVEKLIDNNILLHKIDGFINKKILLDCLLKLQKERDNKFKINTTMYHPHETTILNEIEKYNYDNNKSEFTYDLCAGGLLNDW
jgi:hypothetical protein